MNNLHLLLLIFATWRLANLLANEDGPGHFLKTFRSKLARAEVKSRRKNGLISRLHLYEGVNCEYCNSIWFGSFFAALYALAPNVAIYLAFPLALSTGAILVKHVTFLLKSADHRLDQMNQDHDKPQPVQKVVAEKAPLVAGWTKSVNRE